MKNLKSKLSAFIHDTLISRALHTAWQAALAVLVVSLTSAHSSADVRLALIAAVGAGLSAIKTLALSYIKGLKG